MSSRITLVACLLLPISNTSKLEIWFQWLV